MAKLDIFIGSSGETKEFAGYIAELLSELDPEAHIQPWWNGVFAHGDTHIESLLNTVRNTNAAVLVFAEDDQINRRGEPLWVVRDNVLFEYGIFVGSHGRENVTLARLGKPEIPSDLLGMNLMPLQRGNSAEDFKTRNRAEIRRWLERVKRHLHEKSPSPQAYLPQLYKTMLEVLGHSKDELAVKMDQMAADMVSAMAVSLTTDNLGVSDDYVEEIERHHLNDAVSISAYDVTGVGSWVNPRIFRYLAGQTRKYLEANTQKGKWNLLVDSWLGAGITKAIENARSRLQYSWTKFDNPEDFHWDVGTPKLQYSRVLIWTKEELKTPIAESVIAFHEAFNIPLFFIEAPAVKTVRQVAYIVFENQKGVASGFYGKISEQYHTHSFKRDIPGFGNAIQKYRDIIARPDIMFASDARYLLLNGVVTQ